MVKYIKHLSAYFGASLVPMLLMLAINPLIALNMTPEDYAVTGYYSSFNSLISPLIIFYMLHYYNKRYFELDQLGRLQLKALLYKVILSFSFIVTILCFTALWGYIRVFNSGMQFPILPYLAFSVFALPLAGLFNLELADLKMERNSKAFFRLSVTNGIILTILNLLFVVVIKWGASGKLLAPLIANFVVFVILFYKNRFLLRVNNSWNEFIQLIKFCSPLTLAAMLGYFFSGFDKTYMESLGDMSEYGYYIVGASMANYLNAFSTSIASTFQPDIYEAISKTDNRYLFKTVILQVALTTSIVVLFIILCPIVIKILTAGRYMDSITYARIISVSTITSCIYYIINNYTIAKGYSQLSLYTTIFASVMVIIILPFIANKFQYIGGAWMASGSFVILTVINLLFLHFKKLTKNYKQTQI